MPSLSLLRPHRALALPFAIVLYSCLFFINRNATISVDGAPTTKIVPRTILLVAIAVVVSYVVAVAVATITDGENQSSSTWKQWLFAPSNRTLALFVAVSLALGVYIVGTVVPHWFDVVAVPVGVVIGWPLFLFMGGAIAITNEIGYQSVAVVDFAVAIGVALSVTWMFILFGWITDTITRFVSTGSYTGR